MQLTQEEIDQAARLKAYFPFRRLFLMIDANGERWVSAFVDARKPNAIVRNGGFAAELSFGE